MYRIVFYKKAEKDIKRICACYLLYCDDGTIHASDYLVSRVFNYLYSTPGQIVDWITRYRDEL